MKAVAVVVAYEPNAERLEKLCVDLAATSVSVVVVDNSESGVEFRLPAPVHLRRLGFNSGIAAAQNAGIEFARRLGADAVLFFDQDSNPSEGALETLLQALQSGVATVVAPVVVDSGSGRELPSIRLDRYGIVHKVRSRESMSPVPADIVISSGTTVRMSVLDAVGTMDEGLFIDYVDIDWCLRCRAAGVNICIIPPARMVHRIGISELRIGGVGATVHSPQRTYYKTRNCLLLAGRRWVPRLFIAREFISALAQIALISVMEPDRGWHFRAFVTGVWHGLARRSGRHDLIWPRGRLP